MSRATEAYALLQDEMRDYKPQCQDDARFVDDDTNPDHVRDLCLLCPLYDVCHAYARIARPPAGIWAGQRWKNARPGRPRRKEGTS